MRYMWSWGVRLFFVNTLRIYILVVYRRSCGPSLPKVLFRRRSSQHALSRTQQWHRRAPGLCHGGKKRTNFLTSIFIERDKNNGEKLMLQVVVSIVSSMHDYFSPPRENKLWHNGMKFFIYSLRHFRWWYNHVRYCSFPGDSDSV